MKILINALSARLGGGQTYLINLLDNLPDRDDLEILIFAPESLKLPENAKIKRCTTRWPTENPVARSFWERFILPGILRRNAVDVLFCPGGTINTKPPRGCKTVTMFRNMIPFDAKVRKSLPIGLQRVRNWLLERIMLKSMASSDLTIFISAYAREVIEQRIILKEAATIPHGINPAFRTHKKKLARPTVAPDGKFILYVSRFDVYKHHYEVVEAYGSLPADLRQQYKLLLAGECDSPEASRVIGLISRLGLQDQVVILGPVSYMDLPSLYHHSHLVLFASSCENCPNILLEALGAGRPVLSSNVMPMPEFGGEAVAYFSPFDPVEIAAAMNKTLACSGDAERLAAAAAEQSSKFDWGVTASKTWERVFLIAGAKAVLPDC
jgi:glycosyltransferase involved in cell wall biosynthesis